MITLYSESGTLTHQELDNNFATFFPTIEGCTVEYPPKAVVGDYIIRNAVAGANAIYSHSGYSWQVASGSSTSKSYISIEEESRINSTTVATQVVSSESLLTYQGYDQVVNSNPSWTQAHAYGDANTTHFKIGVYGEFTGNSDTGSIANTLQAHYSNAQLSSGTGLLVYNEDGTLRRRGETSGSPQSLIAYSSSNDPLGDGSLQHRFKFDQTLSCSITSATFSGTGVYSTDREYGTHSLLVATGKNYKVNIDDTDMLTNGGCTVIFSIKVDSTQDLSKGLPDNTSLNRDILTFIMGVYYFSGEAVGYHVHNDPVEYYGEQVQFGNYVSEFHHDPPPDPVWIRVGFDLTISGGTVTVNEFHITADSLFQMPTPNTASWSGTRLLTEIWLNSSPEENPDSDTAFKIDDLLIFKRKLSIEEKIKILKRDVTFYKHTFASPLSPSYEPYPNSASYTDTPFDPTDTASDTMVITQLGLDLGAQVFDYDTQAFIFEKHYAWTHESLTYSYTEGISWNWNWVRFYRWGV